MRFFIFAGIAGVGSGRGLYARSLEALAYRLRARNLLVADSMAA